LTFQSLSEGGRRQGSSNLSKGDEAGKEEAEKATLREVRESAKTD